MKSWAISFKTNIHSKNFTVLSRKATYLELKIIGSFEVFAKEYLSCGTDNIKTVLAVWIPTNAVLQNILNEK